MISMVYECKIHNKSSRMCVDVRGMCEDVRGCARTCRFHVGCAPCFSSFRAQPWFLRACAEKSRTRWREYAFCGHLGCFLNTWQANQIIKKLPKTLIWESSCANITASERKQTTDLCSNVYNWSKHAEETIPENAETRNRGAHPGIFGMCIRDFKEGRTSRTQAIFFRWLWRKSSRYPKTWEDFLPPR